MAVILKSNIKSSTAKLFDSIRRRKKASTIRTLIQKGADIDVRDSKGYTPLLLASKYGLKTVVQLLIDSGAKVDSSESPFERTLLHYSSGYGWTDIVKYILKNVCVSSSTVHRDCSVSSEMNTGPIIHVRDIEGRTALHLASLCGHIEVVRCLVEKGANIFVNYDNGRTALHDASRKGHTKVVKFLLGRGANIDAKDKCGLTALHEASDRGHLGVVKCLVAQGTDINTRNQHGQTGLHVASFRRRLAVAKYLLDKGADLEVRDEFGQTALLIAARCLSVDVIILLINSGANVDCCDCHKRTALHYAAQNGWLEMVQYLVKRLPVPPFILHRDSVDSCEESTCPAIHARDIYGRTPLNEAAFHGHLEVVKFLVAAGADLNVRDEDGRTGMIEAAHFGCFEVVKFLVEAKADLSVRDKNGNTALHEAFVFDRLDVMKFLLEQAADTTVKSFKADTVWLIAARLGHKGAINLLVNSGANINGCDKFGRTILHHASVNGWVELVQPIVKRMSDLNARDSNGETALLSACRAMQLDSVKYLLQAGARWDIPNKYGNLPFDLTRTCDSSAEFYKLFVAAGAYLMPADYYEMVNGITPKMYLLQDVTFCCQAIVNKFNAHDLPAVYKIPTSACLPCIEKMVIGSNSEVLQEIERTVELEIQRNGYCNVLEVRPISLGFFSVWSVLKYYDKNNSTAKAGERLVALDFENDSNV